MKKSKPWLFIIGLLIIIFIFLGPFYILKEGELAVVVRFGEIIRSDNSAGLKFKVPLIDSVIKYPKKILSWDGESQRLPTEENQFIFVDTTARWRIANVKKFYEAIGTITLAQSRLDNVIDSSVRKIIAKNFLREAIRNSDVINEIERKNVFNSEVSNDISDKKNDISVISSTYTNIKYPEIKKGRTVLSDTMLKETFEITKNDYGIEMIDIIIRQIKYSNDLTQSVYNRMIKERNQIAQAFRSDGEGEKAKWLGKTEKELKTIRSKAELEAKERKAEADSKALEIRNAAYSKDREFANFWMAIDQYKKSLPKVKKVLSTESEFFKYLYKK